MKKQCFNLPRVFYLKDHKFCINFHRIWRSTPAPWGGPGSSGPGVDRRPIGEQVGPVGLYYSFQGLIHLRIISCSSRHCSCRKNPRKTWGKVGRTMEKPRKNKRKTKETPKKNQRKTRGKQRKTKENPGKTKGKPGKTPWLGNRVSLRFQWPEATS